MSWSIQLPTGEFFESVPALSFELNNQVFSNSDSSVLPGSFSFPVDLPLTRRNRMLLYFPEMVTNTSRFTPINGVWVYAYGEAMFRGTLNIQSANERSVRISIVTNPVRDLKDIPLNTLDLGGDRDFTDEATLLAHAETACYNGLNYDYVFPCIFNPSTDPDTNSALPLGQVINLYNTTTEDFEVDHDKPFFCPQVRVDYILSRIFASQSEYTFINRWQTTEELQLIIAFNNRSLWTVEGLETTFNLQNHVSKTNAAAWLRKLMSGWCLGLFANIFDRTVELIPLRDIISRPPSRDWTAYAVSGQEINSADDQADYLCWLRNDDDGAWAWYDTYKLPANAADYEIENSSNLSSLPFGDYYFEDLEAYVTKGARVIFRYTQMGCGPDGVDTGTRFDADNAAMWDAHKRWEALVGTTSLGADYEYDKMPHIRTGGTVSYLTDPGGPDEAEVQLSAEIPDRITIYRGMYPNVSGGIYPLACGLPYDNEGNLIGEYSLRWFGERGMYEQWWKDWHQMLLNGKPVTQQFALPLAEVIGFSFKEKVRVQSMDFMLKRMRIARLLGNGKVLVEADMISTI